MNGTPFCPTGLGRRRGRRCRALPLGAVGPALARLLLAALAPPVGAEAAFERPALSVDAAALGGVVATSADFAFGNPAVSLGLREARPPRGGVRSPGAVAAFQVARPFGIPALREAQVSWQRPAPWSIAIGGRRFGTDDYAESEIRFTVARRDAHVAVGVAARLLQVHGLAFATRRGAAVDVGIRARPEKGLVIGAVAEAVLGTTPGDPGGLGRRTVLGASRALGALRVHVEADRTEETALGVLLGLSWRVAPGLHVAAGVRERPASLSAGLALPLPASRVSVAASWVPPLGTTLRIGLRIGDRLGAGWHEGLKTGPEEPI